MTEWDLLPIPGAVTFNHDVEMYVAVGCCFT